MKRSREERKLRVLAWPLEGGINDYTDRLYAYLDRLDVDSRPFGLVRALVGRYDVLHVHWPEAFLNDSRARNTGWAITQAAAQLLVCAVCRIRRKTLLLTLHNIPSHERRHVRLEAGYLRVFDAVVSAWI